MPFSVQPVDTEPPSEQPGASPTLMGEISVKKDISEMSLAFVGAGKMAQAMAKGFLAAGVVKADHITATAPSCRSQDTLEGIGCQFTHNNKEAVANSDIIFLSVKPHVLPGVLQEIAPVVTKRHLMVSVAAGVPLQFLEEKLPPKSRVIRVMPNTPCVVRQGASVYVPGSHVEKEDSEIIKSLLSSLGYCSESNEGMISAVTGLAGSGPAYAFTAIDALADGGVKMGLPRELSIKLAAQTLLGASKMVLETGKHPMQLKDDVCSPGGTTIYAIHKLESGGFRNLLIDAVEGACLRADAIAKKAK
ncbi:PREDICTED: pyrroline-5-carboxylate reductase 1, mitochondrial-like isoform X1 [Branchiostoma belcheri]|uniref:Pyrroline-5-carboxylate reductase n=2 Tax=Branchiostoma belcheri TaxID=7741 RepID=A0A6P4YGV5_BRABE|nr:PREDICTED: pyrroline-5-carboxylate reductase 1, mitochondrial-like isoform X1 [Branchiostoma belcheri]